MKVNRAAIRYSKASLAYSLERNIANRVEQDFKNILSTVSGTTIKSLNLA